MDLVFNELSIEPLAEDKTQAYQRLYNLIQTFKKASELGFNRIRFSNSYDQILLAQNYSIGNFCKESQNRTLKTLLYGLYRYPYIDNDSIEEEKYIESSFKLRKGDKLIECYGLAAAYLYSTIGIGFLSEAFWTNYKFPLIIQNPNIVETFVFCISVEKNIKEAEIVDFIENRIQLVIPETELNPNEKQIKLRDDHGKDILYSFAKKLVNSPYVIGIVNSLPFNPHQKKFIKKIGIKGLIEIVLVDTDNGIGLVVQTTGNSIRETTEIAKILEKEFFQ